MLSSIRYRGSSAHSIVDALLALVYPPQCVICESDLYAAEGSSHSWICARCRNRLRPVASNFCPRCSARLGPFAHATRRTGCAACRKQRPAYYQAVSLGDYRDHLRSVCIRAKDAGREHLVAHLSEWLFELHRSTIDIWRPQLILHVPMHWRRRVIRGHVAGETMARVLSRRLKVPWGRSMVSRQGSTRTLKRLAPAERRREIAGSFQLSDRQRWRGLRILLVDDIMTTGATVNELARALKQCGVRRVNVVLLARVS